MSFPIKVNMNVIALNQPVNARAVAKNNVVNVDTPNAVIGTGSRAYVWGDGLSYDILTNTVSVNTVDEAIEGESRPITSNGVYKEIGNVATLLGTI